MPIYAELLARIIYPADRQIWHLDADAQRLRGAAMALHAPSSTPACTSPRRWFGRL